MTVCATAKRRRKQAKLDKRYKARTADAERVRTARCRGATPGRSLHFTSLRSG